MPPKTLPISEMGDLEWRRGKPRAYIYLDKTRYACPQRDTKEEAEKDLAKLRASPGERAGVPSVHQQIWSEHNALVANAAQQQQARKAEKKAADEAEEKAIQVGIALKIASVLKACQKT